MKFALTLIVLLFTTSLAQARTLGGINTSSGDENTFDRTLFSKELTSPITVLVKKGAQSAELVQLDSLDTPAQWNAINGATLVSFSISDDGQCNIGVVRVDMSQTDNILPLEAMAVGSLLTLPTKKLSIVCLQN